MAALNAGFLTLKTNANCIPNGCGMTMKRHLIKCLLRAKADSNQFITMSSILLDHLRIVCSSQRVTQTLFIAVTLHFPPGNLSRPHLINSFTSCVPRPCFLVLGSRLILRQPLVVLLLSVGSPRTGLRTFPNYSSLKNMPTNSIFVPKHGA